MFEYCHQMMKRQNSRKKKKKELEKTLIKIP